ncbi:hypothetical protein BIT28_07545 [Photobacterium proteolyticum]|uniref:Integrase n=1 Tax=Photobacterium proteolyticum TaxID=1903952 RepID=A0A1Q9G6M3_9GAMM|nr:hypothetical protein [Photobacterium proteolyticum]OLQ69828.1 hypothetical protein BIT28_07545 [Photobacterium proteolyticum]
MPEINRFIENQRNYINDLMQQPLTGFTNQQKKPATWDDPAWRFTSPTGQTINFYFVDHTVKQSDFRTAYRPSQKLPDDLRHLLMAYAIEVCAGKGGRSAKADKHSVVRKLLIELADNPAHIDFSGLEAAYSRMKNVDYVPVFLQWLHRHAFIPPTLKLTNKKGRTTAAGDDIIEHKKNSVPEAKVLLALGAIFHDVIPPEREKWDPRPLTLQRDAFVCAMTALAMGSPNRIDAEQTVLTKQRLEDITQTKDGKKETVYYLDWQGSKGFKNNHNHILAVMSEAVDRSLEYMEIACEPARVLARFYENPSLPLKKVLGDFCPSSENMSALTPNMNKPINLIHLGYLLGFYDEGNRKVRVSKATAGAHKTHTRGLYIKPIIDLQPEDELFLTQTCSHTKYLLGLGLSVKKIREIFHSNTLTVAQFQHKWIQYVVGNLTGFPVGYNNAEHGKCKYEQALFSFTGNQIYTGTTSYDGGKSHFAIVPLAALGDVFSTALKKKANAENIFTRHGFSDEFHIKPHQFRHWHNDVADREGIPHAIINLWSGRKTPEQILHYVHRTHAEKAAEISDILFSESGKEITVKVVSQQQYEKLTDTATAVTSAGFCSQNLQYSPCEYLNDFVTQCALCPSSCHAAHDKEALSLLNKDLQVQERRLDDVQERPNFCNSQAMQDWFALHHRNTSMLRELVQLMESKELKPGSVIRLLAHKSEFRITDTQAKTVTVRKFALPDSKKALAKALEFKSEKVPVEDALADIFALI